MKKLVKRSLLSILALSTILSFSNFNNIQAKESNNLIVDKNDFDFEIKPAYVWDFIHGYQKFAPLSTFSYWANSNSYKFKLAANADGSGGDVILTGNINSTNKYIVELIKQKIDTLVFVEYKAMAVAKGMGLTVATGGGILGPLSIPAIAWGGNELANLKKQSDNIISSIHELKRKL